MTVTSTACITPLVVRVLLAQRRLALRAVARRSRCSRRRSRSASACSTSCCGVSCGHQWPASSVVLRMRTSRNSAVGQPWLTGGDLAGLGLAAVEGTAEHPGLGAADGLHASPRSRWWWPGRPRRAPGRRAAPSLDRVEPLAGELEVEALHVDRPRLVADDVEAALDPADQLLGASGPSGAGCSETLAIRWIGMWPGGVGVGAAVGAAAVELGLHRPHRAVELVADEHAVLDDVPALGLRRPRRRSRRWTGRARRCGRR